MSWLQANPFVIDIHVQPEDIDGLGHVNNTVYVGWLERCAWNHSQTLGLTLEDFQRIDRGMAVLRHEIDYLASARVGERLRLGTWIVASDGRLKMQRQFQLLRPADGSTLLRALTTYVCIELSSGRPRRMPEVFSAKYGKALVEPCPMEL